MEENSEFDAGFGDYLYTKYVYTICVRIYYIYIYLKVYTKSERHKQMYMYVCIDDIEISKAER